MAEAEIRESVRTGYIVSLIFVSIMFVTFCCAPNFYMLFRHFSQNEPLATPKTDWAYQSQLHPTDYKTTVCGSDRNMSVDPFVKSEDDADLLKA